MNTFYRFLVLSITVIFCTSLWSQDQVEKSNKQIFLFGKKYYLHEVQKGQTLNSISRAYNVTTQEIISENSALANGQLKVGLEIKIPVNDGFSQNNFKSTEKYIYHTVEKKQTMYFLCKKYNVDESDLVRLNPEISDGLKVGQVLKIPKPGSEPANINKAVNFYTVQSGETLFSIAQKFGVEMNAIRLENPEVQSEGLKSGQVIKIPKSSGVSSDVLKIVNSDSNNAKADHDPQYFEEAGVTPCTQFKYNTNIKFKVAVILPLYIQENYSSKNSGSYYKNTERFYDFYNGLLLAAKKLKENDISIEFYIKDEKYGTTATRQILADSDMKDMDLIIGPVYSENFKLASDFARQNKINIVAPFKLADNNLVYSNPFVFVSNPSDEKEISNLAKVLANSYGRSVIALNNGTPAELETIGLFKSKLSNSYSPMQQMNQIAFKQIDYKTGGIAAVEDALSVGLENFIIVPSKDEVFITNIVTKLNYLTKKYKITIIGMQSWEQYRNIELEYLKNLKFHYCTSNFVDSENKSVKLFDFQYNAYFKCTPSIFAYQGYDIAYYFLNEMKNHGKNFQFCISRLNENSYNSGLRFDFNFERTSPHGGFENNWIRIVKIDENFNLVNVK